MGGQIGNGVAPASHPTADQHFRAQQTSFLSETTSGLTVTRRTVTAQRSAIGIIIFMATLPLQWKTLGETPIGTLRYFHVAALVMVVIAVPGLVRIRETLRGYSIMTAAISVLTAVALITNDVYETRWAEPIQQFVYFGVGLLFAAVLLSALENAAGRRLLALTAPVAGGVFLIEFYRSYAASGRDPITVIRQAITSGDTNLIISGLFRVAFATEGAEARSNFRHEILASLLVAVYLTMLAGRVERWLRLVAGLGVAVIAVLVLLSLSRSVFLATFLVLLAVAVRSVVRGYLSKTTLAIVGLSVVSLPYVGPPAWNLIYQRIFAETDSYDSRLEVLLRPDVGIADRLISGGPGLEESSTHMLVLDVLYDSGVVAGTAAVVLVFMFVFMTGNAFARYLRTYSLVHLAAFGAGALIVVRSFTTGGGYLHQVEWAALGLVVAVAIMSVRVDSALSDSSAGMRDPRVITDGRRSVDYR